MDSDVVGSYTDRVAVLLMLTPFRTIQRIVLPILSVAEIVGGKISECEQAGAATVSRSHIYNKAIWENYGKSHDRRF